MKAKKRILVGTTVVAALVASFPLPANATSSPCIRIGATCYGSLPAALAAADDGDVIRLPAGTYAGGIQITKSIRLVGAGAAKTVIKGGQHVITVGEHLGPKPPSVTIKGLTVTGGRAHSAPYSEDFTGVPNAIAAGAGIEVVPGADYGPGATLRLVDVVVRDNVAAPSEQLHRDWGDDGPICPDGPCPFAGAFGGGIESWGPLTLVRTTVTGNASTGALTSDADGGGIYARAALVLRDSTVSNNRATSGPTWGRFAEGGGIFNDFDSPLTLNHSSVVGNLSQLRTSFPSYLDDGTYLDLLANGGGIHVNGGNPVHVASSHIDGNTAAIYAPNAEWGVINAGIQVDDGPFVMRNSTVSNNLAKGVLASAPDSPGSAIEWDGEGHVYGSRFVGNRIEITALHGDARVAGAVSPLALLDGDEARSVVKDSVIAHNTVVAKAPHGSAIAEGGGVWGYANVSYIHTLVADNSAAAYGKTSQVRGGGIWNGVAFETTEPVSHLVVKDSRITGNSLVGGKGVIRQGAGLFTEFPVRVIDSVIRWNTPDQCYGCAIG